MMQRESITLPIRQDVKENSYDFSSRMVQIDNLSYPYNTVLASDLK